MVPGIFRGMMTGTAAGVDGEPNAGGAEGAIEFLLADRILEVVLFGIP